MFKGLAGAAALAVLAASAPALAQGSQEAHGAVLRQPPPIATVPPPEVVDAAELAEAQAIVAVLFPPGRWSETTARLFDDLSAQVRAATFANGVTDPGLLAILDAYLDALPAQLLPTIDAHLPRMIEATALAYTREFSLAELREIRAFATTPGGRHYLEASGALIGDPAIAAANVAYFSDLQRLQAEVQAELSGKVRAYLEAHPDLAETMRRNAS